ncbi:hypothetical protein C4D60_Mb09t22860 [Musa balbisiana]|uniref:Cytochrome b6-f complex subunit 7 n=1 Tax=Musa balbisiana TaxID=52838 RepID=A0A4S8IIH6_MUSBA|nr:hypothetical protein C4D60_Mb09t22860 [Musa balbisiana]
MATLSATAVSSSSLKSAVRRKPGVTYVHGQNSLGGLKANNDVSSLGVPTCTARCFAMVVSSLRSPPRKRSQGGGALSSTCNAAEEIFKIAAIMNGLVLIGVAVGFVLLRVEASLEEAE